MASGKKRLTQAAGFEQLEKHVGLYKQREILYRCIIYPLWYKQAFAKKDGNGSRLLPSYICMMYDTSPLVCLAQTRRIQTDIGRKPN